MNYEELVRKKLIKPFKASSSQVRSRIELAKRDIRAARATMAHGQGLGLQHCLQRHFAGYAGLDVCQGF